MQELRIGVCYDFRNPPDSAVTDIVTMAMPPGLRANQMSDSLELLFTKVVPKLKLELV